MLEGLVPVAQRFLKNHPDLPAWILIFNALPIAAFVALVLVAAVINFGAAIIFQVATIVISLIWLIPCVVFGSTAAFICYFVFKKISIAYELWSSRRVSSSSVSPPPPPMTASGDFFDLPTPPSSPRLILPQKDKLL